MTRCDPYSFDANLSDQGPNLTFPADDNRSITGLLDQYLPVAYLARNAADIFVDCITDLVAILDQITGLG